MLWLKYQNTTHKQNEKKDEKQKEDREHLQTSLALVIHESNGSY